MTNKMKSLSKALSPDAHSILTAIMQTDAQLVRLRVASEASAECAGHFGTHSEELDHIAIAQNVLTSVTRLIVESDALTNPELLEALKEQHPNMYKTVTDVLESGLLK